MNRPRALGCWALLLVLGGAGVADASVVLEPSEAANVRRVVGPRGADLGAGWSVTRWEVDRQHVAIDLEGPGAKVTVALRGERPEGSGERHWVRTRQGWLRTTPGLPEAVVEALKTHLERPGRDLAWRRVEPASTRSANPPPAIDPTRVEAGHAQLRARVEARLHGGPLPLEPHDSEVAEALALLLGGDVLEVNRRYDKQTLDGPTLPPGLFSIGLAAGHRTSESVPALLERHPQEPRLLSMMADRAFLEGRYDAAAWWLDAALKTPVPDGEALRLARLFGWSDQPVRSDVLPSAKPDEGKGLTTWAVVGLLAWLLFAVAAARRRRLGAGVALAAALVGALLAIPPRPALERPALPSDLVHPLAGDPCDASATRFDGHALSIHLRCDGTPATLVATSRGPDDEAFLLTEHHAVAIHHGPDDAAQVEHAASRFHGALAAAEAGGFRIMELPWTESPVVGEGWPDWRSRSQAERDQHRVLAGVMSAALVLLLFTLVGLLRDAGRGWSHHPRTRWWLAGALGAAILLHLLVPERMVMVFGGYDLTQHLVDGVVPRYGGGALWLYGPLLWTFGHDHAVLQLANRILGLLLVVVAWDLGRRLHPSRPRAMAIAAWLMALMPVIWRAHSSESIVVGPALLVLLAMRALSLGEDARPTEAGLLGAAAATVRPEIALIVFALPIWARLSELRWRREALGTLAAWVGALLVVGVQIVTVVTTARALVDSGALPAVQNPFVVALGAILWVGIFANVTFTPVGLVPLVVSGVVGTTQRRRAGATLALAVLWIVLTSVDLVEVSVPRLHTPALLLALPLAALGWEQVESWCRQRGMHKATMGGLALVLVAGAAYNAQQMFRATNEDVEEALWREAIERLPADTQCLSVMGYGDPPPAGKTPRHNPTYLLRARHSHVTVTNLSELQTSARCSGGHVALLGLRCYADLREDGRPQPVGGEPLPVCASARAEALGEPLFEREVVNHGDLAFELYPLASRLRVGLYRVTAP